MSGGEETGATEVAGVWVYEVAEPFGRWVAEVVNSTGEFPGDEEARVQARKFALDLINK